MRRRKRRRLRLDRLRRRLRKRFQRIRTIRMRAVPMSAFATLSARSKDWGPSHSAATFGYVGSRSLAVRQIESLDRVRERVRARFNAVADLGSQFRAGISLASGDINDPTSTNQTLTGFYARKTIALDQAFVEYKPKRAKFLDLIGGKFRYPWFNTELTWDKDLNPEGVAETFAFDVHTPVLKRFAVVAFQLPFAEVAHTSVNDKRMCTADYVRRPDTDGVAASATRKAERLQRLLLVRWKRLHRSGTCTSERQESANTSHRLAASWHRECGSECNLHYDSNERRDDRGNSLSNRRHEYQQRAVRVAVRVVRQYRTFRHRYPTP